MAQNGCEEVGLKGRLGSAGGLGWADCYSGAAVCVFHLPAGTRDSDRVLGVLFYFPDLFGLLCALVNALVINIQKM